ncbi:MAG: 50S ribosomal protein L25/general stress protein Ctc [Rickettsiales bacterium]|jgi:large subunit ribosomal protein L25|nr:50S ribosomal protein L25/general stress protein Ctc [Rickettsiales bacterium]
MSDFTLKAELRSDIGKGASRRLRRLADKIPAIVYGGKEEAKSITLDHDEINNMLDDEAAYSSIINLDIEGETEEVLITDLQRHPFKLKLMHVDFKRIVRGEDMLANIPLHLINEDKAPGKKSGGVVTQPLTVVEISCRPSKLPEYIEVDLSNLEIGESIHLSEVELPEGVQIAAFMHGEIEEHDQAVVNMLPPAVEESDDDVEVDETEVPASEQKADAGDSEEKNED